MNEPDMSETKGWGCLPWSVVGGVLTLLVLAAMPGGSYIGIRANQMKAASNARQIIGLLLTYASDNSGNYPDALPNPITHRVPETANEAFRALVHECLVIDETIFGCPGSRFIPDKNLGTSPNYDQALIAGENHWMMVAGMSHTSPSYYPMVMENTADATWPPTWISPDQHPEWLAKMLNQKRGRGESWKDGRITVGFNDASVVTVRLEKKGDRMHLPKAVLEPADKASLPTMKLLDIEEVSGDLK